MNITKRLIGTSFFEDEETEVKNELVVEFTVHLWEDYYDYGETYKTIYNREICDKVMHLDGIKVTEKELFDRFGEERTENTINYAIESAESIWVDNDEL
jgi:hypothetical protein